MKRNQIDKNSFNDCEERINLAFNPLKRHLIEIDNHFFTLLWHGIQRKTMRGFSSSSTITASFFFIIYFSSALCRVYECIETNCFSQKSSRSLGNVIQLREVSKPELTNTSVEIVINFAVAILGVH